MSALWHLLREILPMTVGAFIGGTAGNILFRNRIKRDVLDELRKGGAQ